MTRRDLQATYAPDVSIRTIDGVLRKHNIRKWRATKRPKLTEIHAQKRLEWARQYRHWTVEDWEGIVWSDECSVEKSDTGCSLWVYRTPKERWTKDYVEPKRKGKGVSLMVWGCFWGPNRGQLVPIVGGTLSSPRYLELLKEYLLPVICRIHETIGDPRFQQDNALIHKGKIVMDWFESVNVDPLNHPPYSPDLNPIEHVW